MCKIDDEVAQLSANGFISSHEIAQKLGVCLETVKRWVRKGRFLQPHRPHPQIAMWKSADVDAWTFANKKYPKLKN